MRSTGFGRRVTAGAATGRPPDSCSRAQQPGQIAGTAPSPLDTDEPQVGQTMGGIEGRLLRSAGPLLARAVIPFPMFTEPSTQRRACTGASVRLRNEHPKIRVLC